MILVTTIVFPQGSTFSSTSCQAYSLLLALSWVPCWEHPVDAKSCLSLQVIPGIRKLLYLSFSTLWNLNIDYLILRGGKYQRFPGSGETIYDCTSPNTHAAHPHTDVAHATKRLSRYTLRFRRNGWRRCLPRFTASDAKCPPPTASMIISVSSRKETKDSHSASGLFACGIPHCY